MRYYRLKQADAVAAMQDVWNAQDMEKQPRTVFNLITLGAEAVVNVYNRTVPEVEKAFIGALAAVGAVFEEGDEFQGGKWVRELTSR